MFNSSTLGYVFKKLYFCWVHHHRHHHDELSISRYQALSLVLCVHYLMSPMRGVLLISFLKMRELRQGGEWLAQGHLVSVRACIWTPEPSSLPAKPWVGIDRYFTTKFTMTNTLWRTSERIITNFYLCVPCGIVERTLDQKSGDLSFNPSCIAK